MTPHASDLTIDTKLAQIPERSASMMPRQRNQPDFSALGVVGSVALYRESSPYEQVGAYLDTRTLTRITYRTKRRRIAQRVGPGLIMASFFFLGAAQFMH